MKQSTDKGFMMNWNCDSQNKIISYSPAHHRDARGMRGSIGDSLLKLMFVFVLCVASTVQAEKQYRLLDGKNRDLCHSFSRVVKQYDVNNLLTCTIQDTSRVEGMEPVKWKRMSMNKYENLKIFLKLDRRGRALRRSQANNNKQIKSLTQEELIKDVQWRKDQERFGQPKLFRANVNIIDDGVKRVLLAAAWNTKACTDSDKEKIRKRASYETGPFVSGYVEIKKTNKDIKAKDVELLDRGTQVSGHDIWTMNRELIFVKTYFSDLGSEGPSLESSIYVEYPAKALGDLTLVRACSYKVLRLDESQPEK